MYLSNIKLWNFRKYGPSAFPFTETPNLDLNFNSGLNVLIGANDSGKTAILDAIKLVLKTNTGEWIKVDKEEDFHYNTNNIKIQLRFDNFEPDEARHFAEFLCLNTTKNPPEEFLILNCEISKNNDRVFNYDIKAGPDGELGILTAEQREYLNVTYLKPLRDVKTEFIPKKGSRLSTILKSHEAFNGKSKTHDLYKEFEILNNKIRDYFITGLNGDISGIEIKTKIDKFIGEFIDDSKKSSFNVTEGDLIDILEKLKLTLLDINPGLGSLNRLFIASELLHLQRDYDGLELGIIEEIEAHIHPQAQMKVIESLQNKIKGEKTQLIITTHSPNLASKVKLENLIICDGKNAFPMGKGYTELAETDYRFLERFLDVTKSNLFFSKCVILVEGWAEEILLPTFARLLKKLGVIEKDLTQAEVSIVNVGNDTFFRYAKVFERKQAPFMDKKVAIVTDIDLKPEEYKSYININGITDICAKYKKVNIITEYNLEEIQSEIDKKKIKGNQTDTFLSPSWTLEYCLGFFPKFQELLFNAILFSFKDTQDYKRTAEINTLNTFMIDDFDINFLALGSTNKEKSFNLYSQMLGEIKIAGMAKSELSKTIVAQYFSELLEEEINKIEAGQTSIFEKSDFENISSISYLVNAIKYASEQ